MWHLSLKFLPVFFAAFLAFQQFSISLWATPSAEIDPKNKAISYDLSGRFGNHLITYLISKWIAQKNEVPLLYVPFKYADKFVFHENEMYSRSDWESKFQETIFLKNQDDIRQLPENSLILINLFHFDPELPDNQMSYGEYWNDPAFQNFAKPLLKPRNSVKLIPLPKDKLNVLVHVRTGEGHDELETKLRLPYKFPAQSFYISAIKAISEIFNHCPIYAYIMTDDPHPEEILKIYSKALSHLPNIEFNYRKGDKGPSKTVMEDFFSVAAFDCLIRGSSTFTIAAAVRGDFKAVIIPYRCHVENDEIIVDEIEIKLKNKKTRYKKIEQR